MNAQVRTALDDLHSDDADVRGDAYFTLLRLTEEQVHWSYDVWEELLGLLKDKNNHVRSISAQILSNLAKSDPDNRMLEDMDQLIAGTYDERFVTARHTLESLWKVGIAKPAYRERLLLKLTDRFEKAIGEKNGTLVRFDIIQVLRRIFDKVPDESVMKKALDLIETEADLRYRKKYAGVWKDISGSTRKIPK